MYALAKLYKFDEVMKNLNQHGKKAYQIDFEECFKEEKKNSKKK